MWFHALNLFVRAWTLLLGDLGTTGLSLVLFSFIIPVVIWGNAIRASYRRQRIAVSPQAKVALRDSIKPTLTSMAITAAFLALLLGVATARTVWKDHQELVTERNAARSQSAEYSTRVDSLTKERDALKSERDLLRSAIPDSRLAATKKSLSDLLTRSKDVMAACGGPSEACTAFRRRWEGEINQVLNRFPDPTPYARWTSWVAQNQNGPPVVDIGNEANMLGALITQLK